MDSADERHSNRSPSLRFEGLEVVPFSSRIGTLGGFDLWAATRESIFDLWSTPQNQGPLINSLSFSMAIRHVGFLG
jgi:hypothetical protein